MFCSRDVHGPARFLSQALRRTKSRKRSKMLPLDANETVMISSLKAQMAARSTERYPLYTSCAQTKMQLLPNTVCLSTQYFSISSLLGKLLRHLRHQHICDARPRRSKPAKDSRWTISSNYLEIHSSLLHSDRPCFFRPLETVIIASLREW